MFEEDLDVMILACSLHGGFLLILFLCLILQCTSCWPRYHHKTFKLGPERKSKIRAIVDACKEELKTAVKKVIVARLDDGKIRKALLEETS